MAYAIKNRLAPVTTSRCSAKALICAMTPEYAKATKSINSPMGKTLGLMIDLKLNFTGAAGSPLSSTYDSASEVRTNMMIEAIKETMEMHKTMTKSIW